MWRFYYDHQGANYRGTWEFYYDQPMRATATAMVVVTDGRSKSTC
ncbi:MAG: hypothetical protein NWE95_05315 [Candidatus Bathyarchaeota archaeon]|nr:hypothetical protein [Candidatus Bathyarchaeota archaeon]